ncbi:MAG: hypothetical protein ACKVVP_21385 [Chloroflexota bacterium]
MKQSRFSPLVYLLLGASLFVSTVLADPPPRVDAQQPSPSATPSAQPDQRLVTRLRQQSTGQVELAYHRETGKVRFVGTRQGQPISRSTRAAVNASAEEAARLHG